MLAGRVLISTLARPGQYFDNNNNNIKILIVEYWYVLFTGLQENISKLECTTPVSGQQAVGCMPTLPPASFHTAHIDLSNIQKIWPTTSRIAFINLLCIWYWLIIISALKSLAIVWVYSINSNSFCAGSKQDILHFSQQNMANKDKWMERRDTFFSGGRWDCEVGMPHLQRKNSENYIIKCIQ